MKYSMIIFDFDGTLFDTRKAIFKTVQTTFLEQVGKAPSDKNIDDTIARGITLEKTFLELSPDLTDDEIPLYVKHYRDLYNGGIGIAASSPFPDTELVLKSAKEQGAHIVVVSNKGRVAIEDALKFYNLNKFVSLVVAAEGNFPVKPDPQCFTQRIQPKVPVETLKKVLVVGDTDKDVRFASAINADSCWAQYGYGSLEDCGSHLPDYQISNLSELMSIF